MKYKWRLKLLLLHTCTNFHQFFFSHVKVKLIIFFFLHQYCDDVITERFHLKDQRKTVIEARTFSSEGAITLGKMKDNLWNVDFDKFPRVSIHIFMQFHENFMECQKHYSFLFIVDWEKNYWSVHWDSWPKEVGFPSYHQSDIQFHCIPSWRKCSLTTIHSGVELRRIFHVYTRFVFILCVNNTSMWKPLPTM